VAIARASFPDTYEGLAEEAVVHSIVEQTYSHDALRLCIAHCAATADAHFLVSQRDGEVIGFVHYDCEGPEPELHRIYVRPDLKRSGIGTVLLDELHRRLPRGSSYVLMVVADNRPARAFYERHGFVEEARVDGVAWNRERMGVEFPPGTPAVPGLVLRRVEPPG
jgi:ribosomal protein S18 acetylase RimI-like enzyme